MSTATHAAERERKTALSFELKTDGAEEGEFRAKIAQLNVVDKHGDVTFPGAFPSGKDVVVSAYGHTSWMGALPVGKGVISEEGDDVYVTGKFFLDTQPGGDTYRTCKNLGPLCEWSYGFDIIASATHEDERVKEHPGAFRGLLKVEPYEASPVLLGAGVNTGTEFVKSYGLPFADHTDTVLAAVKAWGERSRELASLRQKDGRAFPGDANRARITALIAAMKAATSDFESLVRDPEPVRNGSAADLVAQMLRDFGSPDPRLGAAGLHT